MDTNYLWQKAPKPVQKALLDNQINEITYNLNGQLWLTFKSQGSQCVAKLALHEVMMFIQVIAQYNDLILSETNPVIDVKLPFQGERMNVTVPPVSECCAFTIRKYLTSAFGTKDDFEVTSQVLVGENKPSVGTIRGTRIYHYHPDRIKCLKKGEAIYLNKQNHKIMALQYRKSDLVE